MRRRVVLALLGLLVAVAWAAAGGVGCWTWSSNPLVAVAHGEQCPELELWLHDAAVGTSELVASGLAPGECVSGFDRDRYQDLFLRCLSTGRSSSLLSRAVLGQQGAELKAACTRVVSAAS